MNTSQINQRIDELEFKLQFQEDTIDSLNQALVSQQKDMLRMQEKLVLLGNQLESYRQQQPIQDGDRPPHY
ncbi:MAG: SlyX family protein [Marinomonas foliarum]|jgi:SlyX protein|uniref:Protein SlyX homolog n=1 Tax=Marinomonas foliarum TaxID=491950 RepID=A0A369AID0_9GAMM|nr:SlyX family protein [Marinomonas foliarum]QRV24835.1 SlyX family protein [Marinomonas foliarum]RCX08046.1 SlyX protein [Marinomonas foliarum]